MREAYPAQPELNEGIVLFFIQNWVKNSNGGAKRKLKDVESTRARAPATVFYRSSLTTPPLPAASTGGCQATSVSLGSSRKDKTSVRTPGLLAEVGMVSPELPELARAADPLQIDDDDMEIPTAPVRPLASARGATWANVVAPWSSRPQAAKTCSCRLLGAVCPCPGHSARRRRLSKEGGCRRRRRSRRRPATTNCRWPCDAARCAQRSTTSCLPWRSSALRQRRRRQRPSLPRPSVARRGRRPNRRRRASRARRVGRELHARVVSSHVTSPH